MNVNPYADDNPFAEMAALVPTVRDKPPAPAAEAMSEDDYYSRQIEAARVMFGGYEHSIKDMVARAEAITVENAEDERAALDLGLPLDRLFKQIENARLSLVDSPGKYVKSINSLARRYQTMIDDGRKAVKNRLADYGRRKALEAQRKAIEEQKIRDEARKAAEAEAAALKLEAEKAGLAPPEIELPPPAQAPSPVRVDKTIHSTEGKATTVKNWKFRVEDPDMVPREYLMVDEKKIRAAVKDGIRRIDGVNIYEDSDIRFSS